jgi:hypothetical protein
MPCRFHCAGRIILDAVCILPIKKRHEQERRGHQMVPDVCLELPGRCAYCLDERPSIYHFTVIISLDSLTGASYR